MKEIQTVKDLIRKLSKFPADMPVRIEVPEGRAGEFQQIDSVIKDHLRNQNTDGDPSEHWTEPEDIECGYELVKGDVHFKYKGKLVLLQGEKR